MSSRHTTPTRPPLTKDGILRAAIDVADQDGLDALTMRRLGTELGVQAMSLYKHITAKDEILDGIVEIVFGGIELPDPGIGWKEAMRQRARSAREVLRRHTWAIGLLESRGATGPVSMRYTDSILGCLRAAGFSVQDSAYAFWTLDSFVYGHVLQEAQISGLQDEGTAGRTIPDSKYPGTDDYPYLAEVTEQAPGMQLNLEQAFDHGLDLIVDALERSVAPARPHRSP